MTSQIEQLVEQIHAGDTRIVLAVTGGGSRAISELLSVPGASRTVVEATVPYSSAAMVDFLIFEPEQFCGEPTVRAMAMASYLRAAILDDSADCVAGIACTASLASDRPKRGPHRIHVAYQTGAVTASASLELNKGARTRSEEEDVAARLILNMTAEACGVKEPLEIDLLSGEEIESSRITAPREWQELMSFARERTGPEQVSGCIFPGAYHPRHDGHRKMAKIAGSLLGQTVTHEISIDNVDKPPLDFLEMESRARQFDADESLVFTRAPTFFEKSKIFPGCTFVVGLDTLQRIADPMYYGDPDDRCDWAIAEIAAAGCRFLVFGRQIDGKFAALCELDVPDALRVLCTEVPESAFRNDVSSTELRRTDESP